MQALALEGIPDKCIESAVENYAEYQFTKTNSPKILGTINDLVDLYTHFILSEGGIKECDLD